MDFFWKIEKKKNNNSNNKIQFWKNFFMGNMIP